MRITQISRRNFLKATGVACTSSTALSISGCFTAPDSVNLPVYLQVQDGQLRFTLPRSEMGQDLVTSFAMLIAEELEAPLSLLKVEFAKASNAIPNQMTVGSSSVRMWWTPMRRLGAITKQLLLAHAAQRLNVDQNQLRANDGVISNPDKTLNLSFAEALELVKFTPTAINVDLKQPKNYSLIGKSTRSVNNQDKATGSLKFVTDTTPNGESYRIISIAYKHVNAVPRIDEINAIKSEFNLKAAMLIDSAPPFIKKIILCDSKTWPLIKAKAKLESIKRTWIKSQGAPLTSEFQQVAARLHKENQISDREISLVFETAAIAHAPMEPEAAQAHYSEDGIELWVPTQAPDITRQDVARTLEIPLDRVELTTVPMGGGFGRKRYSDFAVELALAARALFTSGIKGRITLQWTREDDMEREYYRPPTLQQVSWSANSPNNITIDLFEGSRDAQGAKSTQSRYATSLSTQITLNRKPLLDTFKTGIWRAVEHGYTAFSICSTIDEICRQTKQDPIHYYLNHIGEASIKSRLKTLLDSNQNTDQDRFRQTIETVQSIANQSTTPGSDQGIGFAAYSCFGSHIAVIAKVSVTNERLKVEHIWAAIDCGQPINPDKIKAQIEGGLLFGLSACLHSELNKNKDSIALNFDEYRVLRFNETPTISIEIVNSKMHPTGVGELGVPPIAPAICNAIRSLQPYRYTTLPIISDNMLNQTNAIPNSA